MTAGTAIKVTMDYRAREENREGTNDNLGNDAGVVMTIKHPSGEEDGGRS